MRDEILSPGGLGVSSSRIFVIAEVGVNHNGDPDTARRLIDVAADAGADAVKFQTFTADSLVCRDTPKAEYQKATTGSSEGQYEMLRRLEFTEDAHMKAADQCRAQGIEFMSTPFDPAGVDLLDRIGVQRYKIASGEITNLILLRQIAGKGKPIIMSTGMSSIQEIGAAIEALTVAGASDVRLLHCVSDYPSRPEDINLRVMETLRGRFGVPVGLSDHTTGIAVPIAAAALGACVIEKHITLNRDLPGPDHRASLEPPELVSMIRCIREVESALGMPDKRVTSEEQSTLRVARRSLVAASDLPKGVILKPDCVNAKRPATGISPMELDRVLGRRLNRALQKDALIMWDDLA